MPESAFYQERQHRRRKKIREQEFISQGDLSYVVLMLIFKSHWIKIPKFHGFTLSCDHFGLAEGFAAYFPHSAHQPLSKKLAVAVAEGKRVLLTPASKYSGLEVTHVISNHNSLTRLTATTRGLAARWVFQIVKRKGKGQRGVSEKLVRSPEKQTSGCN